MATAKEAPPQHRAYVTVQDLTALKHQGQGFSFLPRQPVHSLLAGQKASRLRGRGLNFEEIRGYLPGDDIRQIDWKVTARMRAPHTRVYTEERDRPTILVVDQRVNMFFGSRRAMKSVVAAETAALGAWRAVGVGDRVGAVVFNDADMASIRPHRSNRTVLTILGTVARMNQTLSSDPELRSDSARLNTALELASKMAKHDCLVVVVSDFDGADETTRKLMTRIAQHNDVIAGFVYDPLEENMPDLGAAVVGDGRLQVEFDTSERTLRQEYKNRFQDRLEQARKFLVQRRIPLLLLDTDRPVAEQVRDALGYRPRVQSR